MNHPPLIWTWQQLLNFLSAQSPAFLAGPAVAGPHPEELSPVFGAARLSQPQPAGYLSQGDVALLPLSAGTLFLSTARFCRLCGCTELDCAGCAQATGDPCHWVAPDLCSACAHPAAAALPDSLRPAAYSLS